QLTEKKCLPCEGGVVPLNKEETAKLLKQLHSDWQLNEANTVITRRLQFKNFAKTMAFINAVAWIAEKEQHHPDITFGYNYCVINYQTHAIGGLSENDFICAAKIDSLLM